MIIIWLLHAVYSTIIAFGLSFIFGGLTPLIAGVSLIVGAFFGWLHGREFVENDPSLKFWRFTPGMSGKMELFISLFVVFAAYRHFMWMLFPIDFTWSTLNANNLGDLPLHINFIRAFANGIPFPPANPIFASDLLRYPYGADFYNALWESAGMRLQAHLLIVGLLSTLASLIWLRRLGSWWALGAFFLSGGVAGWEVLSDGKILDYQRHIDWKNLFTSVFVTQRGMLFALPIGIWLLVSLRSYFLGTFPLSRRQLTALGLMWGFLPLFHLHAFVAVTLLMAAIAIECGGVKGLVALLRSRITLIAIPPATGFILFSTKFFKAASIAKINFGWTYNESAFKAQPFFYFLYANFGPWLMVPFVLAFSIWFSADIFDTPKRKRLFIELGVYVGLFVLFFNLQLAPWAWDNIKLLIWPYLGFARLLFAVVEPRMGSIFGTIERPVIGTTLFLSGIVAICYTLQEPAARAVPIYPFGIIANTEGALSEVPVTAVFGAATTYAHPLTYFGRMRAIGYLGHVSSHGIDATEADAKLKRIMTGDADSVALAKALGITHIFWGPDERTLYGDGERPWMKTLPNVSRVKGYEIYAVK